MGITNHLQYKSWEPILQVHQFNCTTWGKMSQQCDSFGLDTYQRIRSFLFTLILRVFFEEDILWVVPPPSNCGKWRFRLGSPSLHMFHNPGGDDCILGGGRTQDILQDSLVLWKNPCFFFLCQILVGEIWVQSLMIWYYMILYVPGSINSHDISI